MAVCNEFIYDNLKAVAELSRTTTLCMYEPTRTLYVVKQVDAACKAFYERLAGIDHPRLAKLLYIDETDGRVSVVREYISGDSLAELLKGGRVLSEQKAKQIVFQICEGLTALHDIGLVHRDINPNNLVITSEGNVKIIDYGIVRSFAEEKSADTVILGTPGYAAPEQFGFSQSDAKTDLYAVGVLLNVMLTGELPSVRLAEGPLGRVVRKCTEIDASKRYQTARALGKAVWDGSAKEGRADRLLKNIPGLRCRHLFGVILSVIGYLFAFLVVYSDFLSIKNGAAGYAVAVVYWILLLVIPYICFSNLFDIRNRLPLTAGSSVRTQKIIWRTLGALSVFIGLLVMAYGYPATSL